MQNTLQCIIRIMLFYLNDLNYALLYFQSVRVCLIFRVSFFFRISIILFVYCINILNAQYTEHKTLSFHVPGFSLNSKKYKFIMFIIDKMYSLFLVKFKELTKIVNINNLEI